MTYSGILRHNQAYLGIFRNYSGIFCTLHKTGIFRTHMVYSNHGIFKTRDIFRTMVYPKLWYIQNQRHIQNPGLFRTGAILRTLPNIYSGALWETVNGYKHFASYNYFRNISFSCPLFHEIKMIFFNASITS